MLGTNYNHPTNALYKWTPAAYRATGRNSGRDRRQLAIFTCSDPREFPYHRHNWVFPVRLFFPAERKPVN